MVTCFAPWLVSQPHGSEWRGGSPEIPAPLESCYGADMADELTKEELDRRAGELAHRVMTMPHKRQEWTKPADTELEGVASRKARATSQLASKRLRAGG